MARPRPRLQRNYLKRRSSGKSSDGDIGAALSLIASDQTGQSELDFVEKIKVRALHSPKGRQEHSLSLIFATSSRDECSVFPHCQSVCSPTKITSSSAGPSLPESSREIERWWAKGRFALVEVIVTYDEEADGDWQYRRGTKTLKTLFMAFVICWLYSEATEEMHLS